MELNLKGKTALITGGTKGIGLAIKEALEKEGVICTSWSRATGQDFLENEISAKYLPDEYDILVNNVGGGGSWANDDFHLVMKKNYFWTNTLTRIFLKKKKRKYGRVITISSIFGKEKGHNPGFTAAKAAQIAFMKSLAGNYKNITFNVICPGHIDVGKPFPDKPDVVGKPTDIAPLVTFLCSDKDSHINGAVITVDGGVSHSF